MSRRVYFISLRINDRIYDRVLIDSHYEGKHSNSINDFLIIRLVKILDQRSFIPKHVDEEGFRYFVNDKIELDGRKYKIIWLVHPLETYIGVVNAYRR